MEAVAASWPEKTLMFISRKRQAEGAMHSKCHSAVDMKSLIFTPVEVDSPFCRMDLRVFWRLLLITKIRPFEHIYDEIDKIALPRCFVCHSRCVCRIFLLTSLKRHRNNSLRLDYGVNTPEQFWFLRLSWEAYGLYTLRAFCWMSPPFTLYTAAGMNSELWPQQLFLQVRVDDMIERAPSTNHSLALPDQYL